MSSDLPRTVHQMASYAAYHLSNQATGGRAQTEETVRLHLIGLYPNAPDSDIEAALHYGRESAAASEAFPAAREGQSLSDVANVPEDAEVTVYFRLRWGEGEEAEYRIFPVRGTAATGLQTLSAAAERLAANLGGKEDYPLGEPDETQLFKVDFFND